MGLFKEVLTSKFKEEESIILHRYKSAKFIFILLTLLFSLNFFFVWASFYYNFFIKTLHFSYILLLISFFYYLYYLWKIRLFGKVKNYVFYIIWGIYFIFFLILLLPMMFDWGIFYLKDLFTNLK